ncbi:MinD/ParA family ATP-binding protein [Deefgea rivuli]|uniref:MinD/ParA family ATP-binding protein n=1 Tax=Deefgea rivuli TaxID=400948 RepID=UPI00048012D2|nr:AAA family ATPase [Deefgea rivuli]
MPKRWLDQAAGLRQMVATPTCRTISLSGGRGDAGTTSLVINLAAALAERERQVVVLDEFTGLQNIPHRLHLAPGFELEHVLRREVRLLDTLIETQYGFGILPIAAQPQLLANLNEGEQRWLAAEFEQLTDQLDYLLLDTRPAMAQGVPSLSLAADDVVIVLSNRAESLTDAYATIKQLSTEYARRDFRVLVNRVASLGEAMTLFDRVREVAQQYLGDDIQLKLIGYVPEDEWLNRATRLGRPVLEAFPEAEASAAIRQLADAMLRWVPPRNAAGTMASFIYRLIESSRLLAERIPHGQN